MGKGKSKDSGNDARTDWKEPAELNAFCDLCVVQVLEGKRSGGFLKKAGVDTVIKQLGEMGKLVTHTQFKNKWDHERIIKSVLSVRLGWVLILELGSLMPVMSDGLERLWLVHFT